METLELLSYNGFCKKISYYFGFKYITNKELEIVLRKVFEENTVWYFRYLKTWFNQENYVYTMYCPCGKIYKPWLEKKTYYRS